MGGIPCADGGFLDRDPVQIAHHRRAFITRSHGKRAEIVFTHQVFGGPAHGADIEGLPQPQSTSVPEGGHEGRIKDEVMVFLALGHEARMEIIRYDLHPVDPDGGGEDCIEGNDHFFRVHHRPVIFLAERGDLAEGMDPGIRASGAFNEDFFAKDFAEGELNGFLNRDTIILCLPPGIWAAIIGNGDFESAHGDG